MKRLWPVAVCLLFAGCAMFDDYESFHDGGFYEQPMPVQAAFMPSTPPIATPCNGWASSSSPPAHHAAYQTGEPPVLKQTAEPPK